MVIKDQMEQLCSRGRKANRWHGTSPFLIPTLTPSEAGSVARQAAWKKNTKYIDITSTHIFYPIAIETAGSWDMQDLEVIEEIGRRITEATKDSKETMYRGNAPSFLITIDKNHV